MKRILSILLVALIACGAVFAEFSFSGEFETGYQLNFNGDIVGNNWINGDSDAPWPTYLMLTGSGDWATIAVRGEVGTGSTGFIRSNLAAQGSLHLTQMLNSVFEVESPVTVDLLVGTWKHSADDNWAYYDPSSSFSEISIGDRTSLTLGAQFKYDTILDLVVAGDFTDTTAEYVNGASDKAGLIDAKIAPVDGVKVEVAYAIDKAEFNSDGAPIDDFQAAALVDIGTLIDADFTVGVSAAMSARLDDNYSDSADYFATVYGGYAGATGYVEYVNKNAQQDINFGAQYDITDVKLPTSIGLDMTVGDLAKENGDVYFGAELWGTTQILDTTVALWLGADNFSEFQDTGYVGLGCFLTF